MAGTHQDTKTGRIRRMLQGRRDWRLITWFILAFNLLMLLWMVSGLATTARSCAGLTADRLAECRSVNDFARMQAMILLALWGITDAILGLIWLLTRPRRPRPNVQRIT